MPAAETPETPAMPKETTVPAITPEPASAETPAPPAPAAAAAPADVLDARVVEIVLIGDCRLCVGLPLRVRCIGLRHQRCGFRGRRKRHRARCKSSRDFQKLPAFHAQSSVPVDVPKNDYAQACRRLHERKLNSPFSLMSALLLLLLLMLHLFEHLDLRLLRLG
jgi:hypothetical protein